VLHVRASRSEDTGVDKRPPCAGMTQIRFDGRRLRTFLSARFTGLPCSPYNLLPSWRLNATPPSCAARRPVLGGRVREHHGQDAEAVGAGDSRRADRERRRRAAAATGVGW
jgi:hypothetical protein